MRKVANAAKRASTASLLALTGVAAGLDVVVAADALARFLVLPFGPLLLLAFSYEEALNGYPDDLAVLHHDWGSLFGVISGNQSLWAKATWEWGRAVAAYLGGRAFAGLSWSLLFSEDKMCGTDDAHGRWLLGSVGALAASLLWVGAFAASATSIAIGRLVCGAAGAFACRLAVPREIEEPKDGGEGNVNGNGSSNGGSGSIVGTGAGRRLRATHAMWVLGSLLGLLLGGCLWGRGYRRLPALLPCATGAMLVLLMVAAQIRGRRRRDRRRRRSRGGGYGEERDLDDHGEENGGGGDRRPLLVGSPDGTRSDGAPPDVESGDGYDAGAVPARYLRACGGRAERAARMWEETMQWRRENNVDSVLREQQPNFNIIKECYPHFLHGRSRTGEIICYENPGKMDFGRLNSLGVGPDKLQRHYCFVNDYIWGRLSPGDNDTLMTVLDVGGLTLSTLKGNTVMHRYLAATAEVMQKHYPERQSRIMIVNAPWWFASAYRLAASVLTANTTAKLQVSGTNFLPALLQFVDEVQIPREYGGQSPYPLGEAPEEAGIAGLVDSLLAGSGGRGSAAAAASQTPAVPAAPAFAVEGPANRNGKESGGGGSSSTGGSSGRAPSSAATANSLWFTGNGAAHGRVRARIRGRDEAKARSDGDRGASNSNGASGSSGGGGGGGIRSRLASWMGFRGGPVHANLGVENRFTYDQARQMWVLEGEPEPPSAPAAVPAAAAAASTAGLSAAQEEKAIVEAIQAAHYKSGLERMARAQARAQGVNPRASEWVQLGAVRRGGGAVLALVGAMYICWSALQAGLEALLPVWLLSSAARGGLHVGAVGAGQALALSWLVLGVLHRLMPLRVLSLPVRDPLRAIRVGAGIQISAILLLHGAPLIGLPPSRSPVAWCMVVVATAAASAATALSRSAAGLLLQVALRGVAAPAACQAWLVLAAGIGETAGPILATTATAFAAERGTSYPMDAAFGLNLLAVAAGVCYIATLPLHVSSIGGGGGGRGGGGRGGSGSGAGGALGILGAGGGGERRHAGTCDLVEGLLGLPVSDVGALVEEALAPTDAQPTAAAAGKAPSKRS